MVLSKWFVLSLLVSVPAFAEHGLDTSGNCVEFDRQGSEVMIREKTDMLYCRASVEGLTPSRHVVMGKVCSEQYLFKMVSGDLIWGTLEEDEMKECRMKGAPSLGSLKYQLINGLCFEMAYYNTIFGAAILPQDQEDMKYCFQ